MLRINIIFCLFWITQIGLFYIYIKTTTVGIAYVLGCSFGNAQKSEKNQSYQSRGSKKQQIRNNYSRAGGPLKLKSILKSKITVNYVNYCQSPTQAYAICKVLKSIVRNQNLFLLIYQCRDVMRLTEQQLNHSLEYQYLIIWSIVFVFYSNLETNRLQQSVSVDL